MYLSELLSNILCMWFPMSYISHIYLKLKLIWNWFFHRLQFSSVQFSRSVVSDSLWPHESQHARPPCPSPTLGVHSNSCTSSRWCHPAISSSAIPFSFCPQSLPASESFPMNQLFAWGGQSTGVSALASFPSKSSRSAYFIEELPWAVGGGKGSVCIIHLSFLATLWGSYF